MPATFSGAVRRLVGDVTDLAAVDAQIGKFAVAQHGEFFQGLAEGPVPGETCGQVGPESTQAVSKGSVLGGMGRVRCVGHGHSPRLSRSEGQSRRRAGDGCWTKIRMMLHLHNRQKRNAAMQRAHEGIRPSSTRSTA